MISETYSEKHISENIENGDSSNENDPSSIHVISENHSETHISENIENGNFSHDKNESFIDENANEISETSLISEFAEGKNHFSCIYGQTLIFIYFRLAQNNIDAISSQAKTIRDEESVQSNSSHSDSSHTGSNFQIYF